MQDWLNGSNHIQAVGSNTGGGRLSGVTPLLLPKKTPGMGIWVEMR